MIVIGIFRGGDSFRHVTSLWLLLMRLPRCGKAQTFVAPSRAHRTSTTTQNMKAMKHSPSFFLVAALLALFFASTPQTEAAFTNTLTWAGTTNTNITASNNWSASPAYSGANGFTLTSTGIQYVYTNSYSQLNSSQTFSYMGSNAQSYGVTFGGYSNVLVTNVGTFRLDLGGINATNSSGGRVTIWNTNTSQLSSATILRGNMSVFLNNLYNHSSTARIVTNNLNDLAINNLGVNSASQTTIGGANGVNLTWEGTGTATILGTIMVIAQTNTTGTATNNGALIVKSGTINIATTNGANASTTATNVDNSNVYGWNSGLVITNSGSVYVSAQNSLGRQAYNIKMGTTAGGTTTFGLFDTNSWAQNLVAAVTLTNNFSILNSGTTATNIFKSVTGKTLTLSGVISSTNTNGANTFSNAVVVSNTTLMLSNAFALGATNAGTTVAGTSGRLDLNGQTITAEALTLSNSSAPSLLNSSATAASWSGDVTLAAATTISNAGDITLSGGISRSSSLTKQGAATLILSGSNSYTGATTISNGALVLGNTNALSGSTLSYSNAGTVSFGSLTGANLGGLQGSNNLALTNASGGAVALNVGGNSSNTTYSGILSGGGSLAKAGTGTMILSGSNSFSGGVTISNGAVSVSADSNLGAVPLLPTAGNVTLDGGKLTASSSFVLGFTRGFALGLSGGTIEVAGGQSVSYSGIAAGSGALTKSGAGSLTLSGANSYSGATTVSAGTLELANASGSALGSTGSVTVGNGATLLLSQSDQVNNSATVTLSGGTITRGSGVSEVFGNLNLTQGSFLDFGTGTAGTMTFGTYTPSALLTINNFGSGNTLVFGSDLSSTINNSSYFSFSSGISSTWDSGASTFTITAIPEASTEIAALGLLALCASPLLRRKRAKIS
jgi:fibronectin-binding autotransporter adhesin